MYYVRWAGLEVGQQISSVRESLSSSSSSKHSLSPASKVMNTNSSKKNVTKKTSQPSCCQPKLILELTALIGSRKRKHSPYSEQPRKYISLAEAALSFQRCTPRRFDSRKTSREPTPYKPWLFEPTIQVTPNLTSRLRTRLVHYPTWDQEEEQMKKRLEKAFPLYTDIFKQPKLGIRVEVKQHTTPEPFNLTELEEKEVLQSTQFALQAWPISKGIMENVKGIPEKKPSLATKRFAPKLIKRRIPLKVSEDSVELIDGKTGLKPQEVFNIGVPQVCNERSTPSKRITEVKPFSFEKRDIEIQKKKDEKIKASQDESMKFTFRARPAKVLNQKPFVPKPTDRSPLIPVDLVLNTETRSKIREEFNQYLKERDEHIEQLRAELNDNDSVLKQISPFTDDPAWHYSQVRYSVLGNSRTAWCL
uniref:(California timema) hypothetical protein n=1 Tax=Timema californicum TaxID=61474 RepID=A0A7R9PBB2_TIMCA|nr:unnamed protein product [Timema californicum]